LFLIGKQTKKPAASEATTIGGRRIDDRKVKTTTRGKAMMYIHTPSYKGI
jgi:hypothetical protein